MTEIQRAARTVVESLAERLNLSEYQAEVLAGVLEATWRNPSLGAASPRELVAVLDHWSAKAEATMRARAEARDSPAEAAAFAG